MNLPHEINEKSSFEFKAPGRHILACTSHSTRKARLPMFKAYPLYMTGRNERRSSSWSFFAQLLRLLGRGSRYD
jgi:hypothetical protein